MMAEVPNARQVPGEGRRRWFADEDFDLIVWYAGDKVTGFQLCYDRSGCPRAYTWTGTGGGRHHGIDDGEGTGLTHKATPILAADGAFDAAGIGARFAAAAGSLPDDVRSFVLLRLGEGALC